MPAEARGGGYENALLAVLFFTFGFVFFDRLALAFLFPYIAADLHLDVSHLGVLAAALALTWAISGWVVGRIADRTGSPKGLLIASVVIFSLASLLSGTVSSFGQLLALRLLMGVAEGPVLPLCQTLMNAASSSNRRGLNMGLIQATASGLLGGVLAPPILNWIAHDYGWRTAFYASSAPGLLLAVLIALFVRRPVRSSASAWEPASTLISTPQDGRSAPDRLARNIPVCLAISCFFVTWFILITTFGPSYLLVARHFTSEAQSAVLMTSGVAYVIWGFVVPGISDRVGRKVPLVVFAALSTLTPLAMMLITSPFWMCVVVALTNCGPGCFVLFMAAIPSESVHPRRIAATLGLVMGVGEIVGGSLMPYVAGIASLRWGAEIPFIIAAASSVISAALALLLRETSSGERKRPILGE